MIRVDIQNGKLTPEKHEILIGETIVKNLKEAGIPVKGFFTVHTVETGALAYERVDNGHTFTWRESDDDRENNFVRSNLKAGGVAYKSGRHAEDDEL